MSALTFPFPVREVIQPVPPVPSWFKSPVYPKKLKYIILHATASWPNTTVEQLMNFFYNQMKWSKPGYAFIIGQNGDINLTVRINKDGWVTWEQITWGVASINDVSIHIAYTGCITMENGKIVSRDTRTPAQIESLKRLVLYLVQVFPWVQVGGHNSFDNKLCPCFWAPNWLRSIGLKDENIITKDPFGYSRILK